MNSDQLVIETKLYKVTENSPIILTVIIGNANVGGTSVLWNDEVVREGVINNLSIGEEGESLKHKMLKCTTKIRDINPFTNSTVVTYKLTGGVNDEDFMFEKEAAPGGDVIYSITFVLI